MAFGLSSGAVSLIGGGLGLLASSGESGGQTVSKDPWGPAQKPLTNTLDRAQQLEEYQRLNPWNSLQQTGYQNTFTDLDAFRGQNNGLMQFANRLMGTNYQRGVPSQPAGLLSQMPTQQMPQTGLLSPGIFSLPQGAQYGLVDAARFRDELNPWTATNGIKAPEAPKGETEDEKKKREQQQMLQAYIDSERQSAGA